MKVALNDGAFSIPNDDDDDNVDVRETPFVNQRPASGLCTLRSPCPNLLLRLAR